MSRAGLLVAVAAACVTGALPAAGSAIGTKASDAPRRFGTRGKIVSIAADGPRVALATVGIARSCDRVVVWNERTGSFARFPTILGCPDSIFRPGLDEVALAGTHVAWLGHDGGNNLETIVLTARIGHPKSTMRAYAENGDGAGGDPSGDYLDNLRGGGSLFAYNAWNVCDKLPPTAEPGGVIAACSAPSSTGQDEYVARQQALWTMVVGSHSRRVLTGADARDLVAVDAGRLVVVAGDEVTVYSTTGRPLQAIHDATAPAGGATFNGLRDCCALSGNLLVLAAKGRAELDVYDVNTGAPRTQVQIPAGATLRDLQGSLAAVVKGRRVLVVDVLTGKRLTLTAAGSAPVGAQIEKPGLFMSSSLRNDRGVVEFRPLAWIQQRLR